MGRDGLPADHPSRACSRNVAAREAFPFGRFEIEIETAREVFGPPTEDHPEFKRLWARDGVEAEAATAAILTRFAKR